MRIDSIRLRGMTTYRDEQRLDLAALGPGLIAVAGSNGAGKSTLLEAIPGCLYRHAPSRGNVAALATARDAQIEVAGVNGAPFTARLDVDSVSGKSEAILLDGDGKPVAGPKVRDYDRAIAERFPPLSVYLAAAFACQTGAGSLFRMERAEKRALFGCLLGLDRLERLAAAAREHAREGEQELTAGRTALDAVRAQGGDLAALEAALLRARGDAARAAGAVRDAQDRLRAVTAERDCLTAVLAEAQRAKRAADDAQRRADTLGERVGELRRRLAALDDVLAQADEIRAHRRRTADAEAAAEDVRTRGEEAAGRERAASAAAQAAQGHWSHCQRALDSAHRFHDEATEATDRAREALDRARASARGYPCAGVLDDDARARCPAVRGHLETAERAEAELARLQYDLPAVEERTRTAQAAIERAVVDRAAAMNAVEAAREEANALRRQWQEAMAVLRELRRGDRSADLVRAEAEAGVLRDGLTADATALATARQEADALRAGVPPVDLDALRTAEEAVRAADQVVQAIGRAAQEAQRQTARLEAQVEAARETQAKIEQLAARLGPCERNLVDWRWLARGLGREGVQALELDAAGPRVSGLCNELLRQNYGGRFAVRLDTQAARADGKGVKETFDIVVIDNERGREGNGEDLSGGEKVIIGEALGLAVGLFHAQASGIDLGTVIRDETVGALDPENAERYIAMLRSFLRLGRVHQLLYVAHQPSLVEMADAVVKVADGRIEVSAG